jgi:hypothetical protein
MVIRVIYTSDTDWSCQLALSSVAATQLKFRNRSDHCPQNCNAQVRSGILTGRLAVQLEERPATDTLPRSVSMSYATLTPTSGSRRNCALSDPLSKRLPGQWENPHGVDSRSPRSEICSRPITAGQCTAPFELHFDSEELCLRLQELATSAAQRGSPGW